MNQSESDALRRNLDRQGVRLLACPSTADICYVNTCTVTAAADRSSIQLVRRVGRLKPKPRLVVLGCLAERAPEKVGAIPGVDEVWSNRRKQQFIAAECPAPARSRAFLKVQDGCSQHCTYCVVSRLRGAPRSVPAATVVAHARQLVADGFYELVLTGLNLGTYCDPEGTTLAGLVRRLLRAQPDLRVRLGSLEPDTFDAELLDTFAAPGVCPHVHLPLQSADRDVLAAMGRGYSADETRRLVLRLRSVRPDICIGADVIVGFPAETAAAFGQTREFLRDAELAYLHVFPFSPRPGTVAASPSTSGGHSPNGGVARSRVHELRQLDAWLRRRYEARFVGTVRQAVVETSQSALTDNYLRLRLAGPVAVPPGRPVELVVTRSGSELAGVKPPIHTKEEK